MDFTGLLILAALYALLSLLGKGQRKSKPPSSRQAPSSRSPEARRLPDSPGALDATQQEGSRLEMVLRQFERALEEAQSPGGPAGAPPEEEEWEERESLEVEPEVVSLETEVSRTARQDFTQDDHAEQLVARRISAAAARDKASSRAAHAEFDQRIRQEPADKTATTGYTARQLRDAVVWREILGPPVSLREEARGER